MKRLVIKNATLVTPVGTSAAHGRRMSELQVTEHATIICEGAHIAEIRTDDIAPDAYTIDAAGRVAMPGFVDSHTHAVFGGYRPDEFDMRLKGASYMSIMEAGGGIQSTVNATRDASPEELAVKTRKLLEKMSAMGVTTIEIKSGYGLDTATELKMLEVIERLARDKRTPMDVVATFMGAHAVPREYAGRTAEYTDLVINEMLDAAKGRAKFCDIFCEKNVFELEDSRRLLEAAAARGFKLKLHADEIVTLGGAELAADLGATSADHLLHISDNGIRALAQSNTVATLLPLTAFTLREPYAPARKLIDAGAAVALATDLNPGSCFSCSIPLMIALACLYMNMTIEETITALTLNGAAALDLADSHGSIEVGKVADIAILDTDNYRMLPYHVAINQVATTIHRGTAIHRPGSPHRGEPR
jgi:imidazolonepropionase